MSAKLSGSDVKNQRETERADLYDSTAADSVQVLVSMIMNGVTPANSICLKRNLTALTILQLTEEVLQWC